VIPSDTRAPAGAAHAHKRARTLSSRTATGRLAGITDRADQRVQRGTTVIATFEIAARLLTRPYLETGSHDLVDGTISAEGTTFAT
jgi:hypothetical protein